MRLKIGIVRKVMRDEKCTKLGLLFKGYRNQNRYLGMAQLLAYSATTPTSET